MRIVATSATCSSAAHSPVLPLVITVLFRVVYSDCPLILVSASNARPDWVHTPLTFPRSRRTLALPSSLPVTCLSLKTSAPLF